MARLKPLHINPIAHSTPMGACLAFLGIKNCMPLMHGAQGCASFTKVLFTRHFNDPIAIQTTAVNDITAVFDGGDYGITTAVDNITQKVTPDLIGIFTTGMTETKGDDLRGVSSKLTIPNVYVNTPDFDGGMSDGWSNAVKAICEQLIEPSTEIDNNMVVILPNVSITPFEVERIKDNISEFGFNVFSLPDLSTSLDGFLGHKQGQVSSGGIEIEEIRSLNRAKYIITIGSSMRDAGNSLKTKNSNSVLLHFDSISGLEDSDSFFGELFKIKKLVPKKIDRFRARLQDMMLDTHFILGKKIFLLLGEPDDIYRIYRALNEVGIKFCAVISTQNDEILDKIQNTTVVVGDFDDSLKYIDKCDVIMSNFHGERLAKEYHKDFICWGVPNYEEVGVQYKEASLYEGGCRFLLDIANKLLHSHL